MKSQDIATFEYKVKNIIDWSAIDPATKEVLKSLMAEVAALAEKLSANN